MFGRFGVHKEVIAIGEMSKFTEDMPWIWFSLVDNFSIIFSHLTESSMTDSLSS